ncbi:MAG: hypothetical protein AAGE89_02530 [Pseudomonadota bacterium]
MSAKVKGSIGLPSFNVARFNADQGKNVKKTSIFSKSKKVPPPKSSRWNKPNQIKKDTVKAGASRWKSATKSPHLDLSKARRGSMSLPSFSKTGTADNQKPMLLRQDSISKFSIGSHRSNPSIGSHREDSISQLSTSKSGSEDSKVQDQESSVIKRQKSFSIDMGAVSSMSPPILDVPLNPKQNEVMAKAEEAMTSISDDIESYTEDMAGLSDIKSDKEYKQKAGDLAARKIEIQGKIQDTLLELDGEISTTLRNTKVAELREQLIGHAVDLAFPEMAKALSERTEISDEAQLLLQQNGSDKEDLAFKKLQLARTELVESLSELRQSVGSDAKTANIVTGGFLKALSHSQANFIDGTPLDKAELLKDVVDGVSRGDITIANSKLVPTNDKNVRTLMTALRLEHYADTAARQFAIANDDTLKDVAGAMSHSEIRGKIPEKDLVAFDAKIASAKEAAKLRDQFELQKERTARAVGPEKAHLAQVSLMLKASGARDLDGGHLDPESKVITSALANLAKTNKKGAFQVAKLGLDMEALAKKEQEAFGFNSFNISFVDEDGNAKRNFDANAIMHVVGMTDEDVAALNYDLGEIEDFTENMGRLADIGGTSVKQLTTALNRLKGAGKAALENKDVQDNLRAELARRTDAMSELVYDSIVKDALLTIENIDKSLLSADPDLAVKQAMRGIAAGVTESLFVTIGSDGRPEISNLGAELSLLQERYQNATQMKIQAGARLTEIDKAISEQQAILTDLKKSGKSINPENPRGLTSAKNILKVLALQEKIDGLDADDPENKDQIAELTKTRDDTLKDLRGFDANKMKRVWGQKRSGDIPTVETLKGLKQAAEAIIFVREGAPKLKNEIQAFADTVELERQTMLNERYEAAPAQFEAMQRLIMAAVIENLPDKADQDIASGDFMKSYPLEGQREAILKTLKDWGVDTKAFATEIDATLSQKVDGNMLLRYKDHVQGQSFGDLLGTEVAGARKAMPENSKFIGFIKDVGLVIANKRKIDDNMRQELSALFEKLPESSKFDLVSGTQIQANSGNIPVEPSGTVTVKARVTASVFENLIVERGSKGEFKISGMLGGSAKIGGEIAATLGKATGDVGGGKAELKAQAKIGGDLSVEGAKGFEIAFPPGDKGEEAAMKLIMALTDQKSMSAELFEQGSSISNTSFLKGKISGYSAFSAKAELAWQPGGDDGDPFDFDGSGDDPNLKSGAKNKHGVGMGASFSAFASQGGKKQWITSIDKSTLKTESETVIGVTFKANLYASTFSALGLGTGSLISGTGLQEQADNATDKNSDPNQVDGVWNGGNATVAHDIANIEAGLTVTTVQKKKLEFAKTGPEGVEVLTKSELQERTDGGNTPSMNRMAEAILTEATLEKLKADKEKCVKVKAMLKAATRIGLNKSLFEVTYALDPKKLDQVNELFDQARVLRDNGQKTQAKLLESAGNAIVEDRDNYVPTKISLVEKTADKALANRGNAQLLRVDIMSSTGSERLIDSVSI